MVAHAGYPKRRPQCRFDLAYWITEVLTKRIGFRSLILSDDMEMGGILTHPIEDAAVQAVLAGTHLIEICSDPALILRAYEALLAEAEISAPSAHRSSRRKDIVPNTSTRSAQKPPSPAQIEKLRVELQPFAAHMSRAGNEAAE